jgi:DNA-binding CsgD family transcriptional regulator
MGRSPVASAAVPPDLTAREFEVLGMLADGLAPKQVALRLGCSASTIHNHLHHVYRKLGVSGQAHALLLARDRGWI